MTEFAESDFKACRFVPTYKNLIRTYPVLKELLKDSQDERVLKYILCMYQNNSPLHKEYPDLNTKKQAAATIAGYSLTDPELTALFACEDQYAEMISEFLRKYGDSRLWALIQGDLQMFWEYHERIIKRIDEDRDKDDVEAMLKKSKMSAEAEIINERIERNEKKFYGNDDDLLSALVKKPIRMTPENIADN